MVFVVSYIIFLGNSSIIVSVALLSAVFTVVTVHQYNLFSHAFASPEVYSPLYILVFWCFLPAANALMDYGSWAVSRKLVQGLIRGSGKLSAIWHVVVDVLLAAGFLVLLAALMPIVVQGVNRIVAVPRFTPEPLAMPLPWADYAIVWAPFLQDVIERPFTAGFGVTAMLATTLIPTALHLAAAVVALAVSPAAWHGWVVRTLRQDAAPAALDQVGIVFCLAASVLFSIVLVAGVCIVLWWLIAAALDASLGFTLVDVACWSTRLVSSPGLPIPTVCLPGN